MLLYFFRHGETESDVKSIMSGPGDTQPLNALGITQSEKIAEYCRRENISTIFSSPEHRAAQTMNICTSKHPCITTIVKELESRNWGDWTGKPWSFADEILSKLSVMERYALRPPNGETWEEMEQRIRKALVMMTASDADKIGIITHGGILRALMPIITTNGIEEGIRYSFTNGNVTKVRRENNGYVVETLNEPIL
ncbi:MAG: histidine phosphatase family protein [Patescibacteria group bacterium]